MLLILRYNENSVKFIGILVATDFMSDHINVFEKLYLDNKLPMQIEGTEVGTHHFQIEEYPVEKLMEAVEKEHGKDHTAYRHLDSMCFIIRSWTKRCESVIEEMNGAPLEINVNMDTWLDLS